MNRAGRRGVLGARPAEVGRDALRILVAAAALVTIALGVPTSSAPSAHLAHAAHPVVTQVREAGSNDLVAVRLTEPRTRPPAWPTSDTAAEPQVNRT